MWVDRWWIHSRGRHVTRTVLLDGGGLDEEVSKIYGSLVSRNSVCLINSIGNISCPADFLRASPPPSVSFDVNVSILGTV